jgi:hypothetical protein
MQTDSKLAETKLKSAESAQQKLQAPRKRASVKRAKNADKLREKVSGLGKWVIPAYRLILIKVAVRRTKSNTTARKSILE